VLTDIEAESEEASADRTSLQTQQCQQYTPDWLSHTKPPAITNTQHTPVLTASHTCIKSITHLY